MKIFGIVGWGGSGKTTLIVRLLPILVARGISVSTVKHAHHNFDVDKPGKDSFEHRAAGATEVMVSSANRWALMHENRDQPEAEIGDLLAAMNPVDLVLIEGFKAHDYAKIEAYRPDHQRDIGAPGLWSSDPKIVAVACDPSLPEDARRAIPLPVLDLGDAEAVAAFIIKHCGLDRTGVAAE